MSGLMPEGLPVKNRLSINPASIWRDGIVDGRIARCW